MANEQLSLEEITRMTQADLWDAKVLDGNLRTYRYLVPEESARYIIESMRDSLNKSPYQMDARENKGYQILFTRFDAPSNIQQGLDFRNELEDARRFMHLPPVIKIIPEHDYSEFGRVYYIDSSLNDTLRVRDSVLEWPSSPDKKMLVLSITDQPGSSEKALLMMNAFYSAYTKATS